MRRFFSIVVLIAVVICVLVPKEKNAMLENDGRTDDIDSILKSDDDLADYDSTNDDSTDDDSVDEPENDMNMPQGNQVDDLCYGYELEIITPDGILNDTVNPVKTGKVTIINFWGTWCTPCVNELPYFNRIANEYSEDVTVIAVHTDMVHETAFEFIQEYYFDSNIVFAKDYTDGNTEAYYTALGGRGTYPYTVVLNEKGIISSIFLFSVEYSDLQTAVIKAMN